MSEDARSRDRSSRHDPRRRDSTLARPRSRRGVRGDVPTHRSSVLANPSFRRFPTTYVTSIRQARRRIDMLRSMLRIGSLEPDRLESMLLLAEARQFLISTSDGLAFIDAVKRSVRDTVDDLALDTVSSVTLSSGSGGVPVTISNGPASAPVLGSARLAVAPRRADGRARARAGRFPDGPAAGATAVDRPVPGPGADGLAERPTDRPADDRRAFDRVQPHRVAHHDRSGAGAGRGLGQEVPAEPNGTTDDMTDDKVDDGGGFDIRRRGAPSPNAAPPRAAPPSEDSTRAFVRNTVVMSTGTALRA